MSKIIKLDNLVIVTLSTGESVQRENLTTEDYLALLEAETDEEIMQVMDLEYAKTLREYNVYKNLLERVDNSTILTRRRDSVYWEEISQLSIPQELVASILDAEDTGNDIKLETYKNFWTLMSLNPDEECRKNLFWFLTKNGILISRSGFFVGYRNVERTSIPDVYTDRHTHSFSIKIGEMVSMNRKECDSDSNEECSRGLHIARRDWLEQNYYGSVGLVCLVNPANVVAVPFRSEYGKLRTCAYLPIALAEYGEDGHPLPYKEEDGFECKYVHEVIYKGLFGTEKDAAYKLVIPEVPGLDKESIADKLLDLARTSITNRVVH